MLSTGKVQIMIFSNKWKPIYELHEDGVPYILWDIRDPASIALFENIEEYDSISGSYTHCISVRDLFMQGFDDAIDRELHSLSRKESTIAVQQRRVDQKVEAVLR